MNNEPKIFVAGHKGMVGSAIMRQLVGLGTKKLLTRTHAELDLTEQAAVRQFFSKERPDQVYLAAARVGGILANEKYPAEFIHSNIMIEANVIDAAFKSGVKKLMFLGSSCIYPKDATQPMSENELLTGPLELTNEPYAIAKIAGIKLCESYNRQYGATHDLDYRCVMPSNLYGPGDYYHPENSHVIPGLIERFHTSKLRKMPSVSVWGSGSPRREFLHVDDLASACVYLMNLDKPFYEECVEERVSHVNVGSGVDIAIRDLAKIISKVVGYEGVIRFDTSKPDGVIRKLLNSNRLRSLGWSASVDLEAGLEKTYQEFFEKKSTGNVRF
ncbi:MAG: GDP-L-fucose synthase [Burkholderiales bacterium]|nr:GDP-L-fucose synthase [Burkholderiales bacterium]